MRQETIIDAVGRPSRLVDRVKLLSYKLAAWILIIIDVVIPILSQGIKWGLQAGTENGDPIGKIGTWVLTYILPLLDCLSGTGGVGAVGMGLSTAAFAWILAGVIFHVTKSHDKDEFVHDELENCIVRVVDEVRGRIVSLDVFAYSAKNYLAKLSAVRKGHGKIRIEKVRLLLCRANESRAWQSHQKGSIDKYYEQIKATIDTMDEWVKNGWIEDKNWEMRYIDDRLLCHFAIINGKYVVSGAMPLTMDGVPAAHGFDCYVIPPEAGNVVESYAMTFDTWFRRGFYDSGLKELNRKCKTACTEIIEEGILKNRRSSSFLDFRNIPLVDSGISGIDFYVLPDSRPISKLHIVLMCKYHVLNLYDYFRRTRTKDGVYKNRDALKWLLDHLRAAIKDSIKSKCSENKDGIEDIIVFEHGSMASRNGAGHSSIDHMHLHVILKHRFNVEALLADDSKRLMESGYYSVVEWDCSHKGPTPRRYHSIDDFVDDPEMGRSDYFLIWDPSIDEKDGSVFVYLMENFDRKDLGRKRDRPDVHQYLRRIFYEALPLVDQETLYPAALVTAYKEAKPSKKDMDVVRREIWRNDEIVLEQPDDVRERYVNVGAKLTKCLRDNPLGEGR